MAASNPSEWRRLIDEQKGLNMTQEQWRARFCAIMQQEQTRMTTEDILNAILEGSKVMAEVIAKEKQRSQANGCAVGMLTQAPQETATWRQLLRGQREYNDAYMLRLLQESGPGDWQTDLRAMGIGGFSGYDGGRQHYGGGGFASRGGGGGRHGNGQSGGSFGFGQFANRGNGSNGGTPTGIGSRQRQYRYAQKSYISAKSFLDQQREHDGDDNRPR